MTSRQRRGEEFKSPGLNNLFVSYFPTMDDDILKELSRRLIEESYERKGTALQTLSLALTSLEQSSKILALSANKIPPKDSTAFESNRVFSKLTMGSV